MASAATTPHAIPNPSSRRRWFRFGLLTLLGLVAVSAIVLGLVVRPAQRQRRAVTAIESLGGHVGYEEAEHIPSWLRKRWGNDYFEHVSFVTFSDPVCGLVLDSRPTRFAFPYVNQPEVRDAGLDHLEGMSRLEVLALNNTQVGDAGLEHLKRLMRLRMLNLNHTQITDAGLEHLKGLTALVKLDLSDTQIGDKGLSHLKGLTRLKVLYLDSTNVGDEGMATVEGFTELEDLDLSNTQVGDAGVAHLRGLTKLRRLYLNHTQVTLAGLAKLRRELPDCNIDVPP